MLAPPTLAFRSCEIRSRRFEAALSESSELRLEGHETLGKSPPRVEK